MIKRLIAYELAILLFTPVILAQTTTNVSHTRIYNGPATVQAGQPLMSQYCAISVEECVTISNSPTSFTGAALETTAPGSVIHVVSSGKVTMMFDNQPILGNIAQVGNSGYAHDSGTTSRLSIFCGQSIIGRILQVIDSSHAVVDIIGIAQFGNLIQASCLDNSTMIPWLQANQLTNTGPQGPQGIAGINGTNGTNGAQGPIGLTGPAGVNWYLNNTLVSSPVKCNHLTGTTATGGTYTFSYSSLSYTALVGYPQPSILAPALNTNSYTINVTGTPSITATSVYASQSSLITVAGIQVSLLGAASSAPVGLWVCGY